MPQNNLPHEIKGSVKSMSVLAGAISSGLPGATYFLHYAPPLFAITALLSGGVGLAVFVRVFVIRPDLTTSAKKGFRFVMLAVVAGSVYSVLLPLLTVTSPSDSALGKERFQIGFRTLDFSLTDEAKKKRDQFDLRTPEDLMLAFGGYESGGAYLIWRTWTIVLAGFLLIGLFITTFMFWAHGLALLAWSLSRPPTVQP